MEDLWHYLSNHEGIDEEKVLLDLFVILVSARDKCGMDAVAIQRLRNAFVDQIELKLPGFGARSFERPRSPQDAWVTFNEYPD